MSNKKRKPKVGRNDPCPCGSGKKYKKCHGRGDASNRAKGAPTVRDQLKEHLQRIEALQIQRQQQQGLGRNIISTEFKGYRIVAVGSTLYYSKSWKTFHDFLVEYPKFVLGREWGTAELKKAPADQHPIIQWYAHVCEQQKATIKTPGVVHTAPMTGAVAAYINLAYNLYLLAHNVELQSKLIERLRNPEQFRGALYETYVAAAFIKAGFHVEFERESDPTRSHCEFTATYPPTGRQFSVEAKSRAPGKVTTNISNQLYAALRKEADHKRVIFVDVNVPDESGKEDSLPWLKDVLETLRKKETTLTINGAPAPSAYVFVTNHPFEYSLTTGNFRRGIVSEGFKMSDYRLDAEFSSLRDALTAREAHIEMFRLMDSLREHYTIPSTFDGEIPELAFEAGPPRLQIGNQYLIPDEEGNQVVGKLVDATVDKPNMKVIGIYSLENGHSIIATIPMTPEELTAYQAFPDTFFGIHRPQTKILDDPISMYDWFYETYRHSTRERLLSFMSKQGDFEELKSKSQEELARLYCEGLVYAAMNSNNRVSSAPHRLD